MYFVYLLMTLIPAIPILIWVYRCKESPTRDRKMVLNIVLWILLGIVICTVIQLAPGEPGGGIDNHLANLSYDILRIGIPEETIKLAAVLLAARNLPGFWKSPHLIPCVLFSNTIFAIIENAFYMADADLTIAILRSATTVFAHGVFGLFTILLHLALTGRSKWLLVIGILFAGVVHGLDDYILINISLLPQDHLFIPVFLLVVWPAIVVVSILFIYRMTKIYRTAILTQDSYRPTCIQERGLPK